ncbi:MAG TPA: hypothetical protein VJ725_03540 [Thermoanaerobaculia bacterium]|nr:hypothetical protein [Thermoanaerobaculia bacterium]
MIAKTRFASLAFLLTLGLTTIPASATPVCQAVHGRVEIAAYEPTCGSAIALCAHAMLHGTIKATSDFIGTGAVPTADTPTTGVLTLTGDNVFHTTDGDFFTKDAILLNTGGDGEFSEIDTITGGTGEYEGATGYLIASGTFSAGTGVGTYVGKICRP